MYKQAQNQLQSLHPRQKLSKYTNIFSFLALFIVIVSSSYSLAVHSQTSNQTSTPISNQNNLTSTTYIQSSVGNPTSNNTQSQSRISNQVTPVATQTITGELIRIEPNTLFVSKDSQVKQYAFTNDIKVKRDGFESSINVLRIGDTLTINQSQDGQKVFSIDAISARTSDLIVWAIAAAILATIMIILAIYHLNRSKRGHIRTNTSTRS
jgi:hypothetical protein